MNNLDLPQKLYFPSVSNKKDYDNVVNELYAIFEKDFIKNKTHFRNKQISIPQKYNCFPDIFYHIISREQIKGSIERQLDYKRAKRLPWIKPIIENYDSTDLKTWRNVEFDKKIGKEVLKYYLWYEEGKYIVILKELQNFQKSSFLVTAFYVNEKHREYYQNKYIKGDKLPWA